MARIETKLDGHHDAHVVIDKSLEHVHKRLDAVEAEQAVHGLTIATSKARLATLVTVGSALAALVAFVAEHLLGALKL